MRKISALLLLCLCFVCQSMAAPLWLRYPSISPDGSKIAFNYGGALYVAPTIGGDAQLLTTVASYNYAPVWSPDSRTLAFASDRYGNFDVFTIPAAGGEAVRITTNSASDTPVAFTNDGKNILYLSHVQVPAESVQFPKNSFPELYSVSVDGGRPVQVLATPTESVCFFSDGKSFLYHDLKGMENKWRKHHTSSVARDIWRYDYATGKHTKLTSNPGEDRDPRLCDGDKALYFLSERNGGSFNVYKSQLNDTEHAVKVTNFETHPVRFLSVSKAGTLCYGYDGEIYTQQPNGAPKKLNVSIKGENPNSGNDMIPITNTKTMDRELSKDGKLIVSSIRGDVFVSSVEYGTTKQVTQTPWSESHVSFSPDSRTVLYEREKDGNVNIYTSTITRNEERNFANATLFTEKPLINDDNVHRTTPKYSPDGKEVAFVEDRNKIMVLNIATGNVRQITDGSSNPRRTDLISFEWSPNGKWIVFEGVTNKHDPYSDICVVSAVNGGEIHKITNSAYMDGMPKWILNGDAILYATDKYAMRSQASWGSQYDIMIAFLNQDAFNRFYLNEEDYSLLKEEEKEKKELAEKNKAKGDNKKTKKSGKKVQDNGNTVTENESKEIEWKGIENRTVKVSPMATNLIAFTANKEGDALYFVAKYEKGADLWKYDVRKRSTSLMSKNVGEGTLKWDKDYKNLYLLGERCVKMSADGKDPKPISINGKMRIDCAGEREYMFQHVWMQERDCFYNTNMHGVDWDMMRKSYVRFLPYINNNYDFAEMLSEMLGELNVSHTGASFYNVPSDPDVTAKLGLLFDLNYRGDGLKVNEVVANGPFDTAISQVKAGDIIEKIDGVEIKSNTDYYPLLNHKRGQKTLISLVNKSGKHWDEIVKPISTGALNDLLYDRWVQRCAAKVDSLSNGRLGYVHIRSMGDGSYREIYSDLLGKYNTCDGIVIDVRYNGGGRLHEDIEILFSGEKYFTQVIRGKEVCDMPSRRWNKPSIMLTCEACYSNAHGTPWVYQHRNIGKVVGSPVPGTMTSVNWETLQDDRLVFGIPVIGYRLPDGSYLENTQLMPDILVYNKAEGVVKGEDDQLKAAVEELLREIDAKKQ